MITFAGNRSVSIEKIRERINLEFAKYLKNMSYETNQIPPTGYQDKEGVNSLLEKASTEAGRILRAIQAIAGTENCKGVQINGLKKFAKREGCWIDDAEKLGVFSDRGSENEVYMRYENERVYKLNDFRYSDVNLTPFFERIKAHNLLFADCAYTLEGFSQNQDGAICAVISQPFIRADREATIEEIAGALSLMGFLPQLDGEYFTNGIYDIFDALPNNVLHGVDGQIYFIDTIIYRASADNINTYESLSPRFSKD